MVATAAARAVAIKTPWLFARVAQHAGVHGQDVRHRKERGDTSHDFWSSRWYRFLQMKELFHDIPPR